MSKRRSRTRKKIITRDYKGDNRKLNVGIVVLLLIIVIAVATYVMITKNENSKEIAEKERIKNQQSEIFQATNEELKDLDDYKTSSLIRISAVGDILCGNNLQKYGKPYDYVFDSVRKKLKNTDLTIGTYETNVTDNSEGFAESVKNSGINFVSLAHNHALDLGIDNLNKTNEYLNDLGIKTVGIYEEKSEDRVRIFEKKGAKIAILAYTYNNKKQGVNIFEEEMVKADLEYAKQNSNFTIVMMHWGEAFNNEVSDEQYEQAQFLIENGADIIIGAHPSVVQKMEIIKNNDGKDCLVGYSLGDFTSDFENENSNLELILDLQIYVDTEGNASLYKVDYTPIYMIDFGKDYYEKRFKILDVKSEISDYEKNDSIITEDDYNKLINAVDRLSEIITK